MVDIIPIIDGGVHFPDQDTMITVVIKFQPCSFNARRKACRRTFTARNYSLSQKRNVLCYFGGNKEIVLTQSKAT